MSDGEFSPKDPAELEPFSFDFADRLDEGETLTGTPTVTVVVVDGADASPSAMLSGSPSIVGTQVRHKLTGGVAGVTYEVRAVVSTSASNTLKGCATLLVQAC